MGSQLVGTFKYGLLAVVAFVVPRMITESGHYCASVEKGLKTESPENREKNWLERLLPGNSTPIDSETNTPVDRPVDRYDHDNDDSAVSFRRPVLKTSSDSSDTTDWFDSSRLKPGPVIPLEELIRFDHLPGWITGTWPRVDCIYSDPALVGYRVMVSTGERRDDLAGVMTFYFDQRSMRRITFSGQAEDPAGITRFLASRFGMVPVMDATKGETRYESTITYEVPSFFRQNKNAVPKSELSITPSSSFYANSERHFYDIYFRLENGENR